MGDLAQAIVSLARAAEQRRGAKNELVESTDLVAKVIRDQLRSGDEVQVESATIDHTLRAERPLYRALRVRRVLDVGPTYWKDVLGRDFALIGLGEDAQPGQYAAAGDVGDFYPALPVEREAFAQEAGIVIEAFAALLQAEAKSHVENAKKVVKHSPR